MPVKTRNIVQPASANKELLDFYEAKATYYRDFATIFGIIFGFLSVALFVGRS